LKRAKVTRDRRLSAFAALTVALSLGAGALAPAPAFAQSAKAAAAKPKAKAAAAKKPASKASASTAPEAPPPSEVVLALADWAVTSGDNRGLPFAVIDKAAARLFVYAPDGELKGTAPVLLGLAIGDHSTPGVGDRELSDIAPEERTTPAGRFMAAYGPATGGKTTLWVDYGTAISLHPVVNTNKAEGRPKRLASETAEDNRITFGCINVASTFYRKVVRPTFAETEGVFYVLPDVYPLETALPVFAAARRDALMLARRERVVDPLSIEDLLQTASAP
jgi:hypothetical protein